MINKETKESISKIKELIEEANALLQLNSIEREQVLRWTQKATYRMGDIYGKESEVPISNLHVCFNVALPQEACFTHQLGMVQKEREQERFRKGLQAAKATLEASIDILKADGLSRMKEVMKNGGARKMASEYNTALVCLNGHIVTSWLEESSPDEFCSKCGESTISACPECEIQIRGFVKDSAGSIPREVLLHYCFNCGNPYPWTQRTMEAAMSLVDELDGLDEEDKETLKQSINDLVRESPQTTVAVTRFKRLMQKTGGKTAVLLKELVVETVAETTKRMLTG